MNRVRRPGQAEFIQVLRRVNNEKIQYLISSNVSFDIESALFKGQVDQKVKSNQLVRDFKLKYNFGMIKNEILPSQKNDVLDGRRYAFLGIFGIVLTWRIFQDHKKIKKKNLPPIPYGCHPYKIHLPQGIGKYPTDDFRRVLENTLRVAKYVQYHTCEAKKYRKILCLGLQYKCITLKK